MNTGEISLQDPEVPPTSQLQPRLTFLSGYNQACSSPGVPALAVRVASGGRKSAGPDWQATCPQGRRWQPDKGASFKRLPTDLNSHCDSWSCQPQPVSLLEEEEGNEGVNFFSAECKQETKQALCTWPQPFPTTCSQGGHRVQRKQQTEGRVPGAKNELGSLGLSEPGGWRRLRVLTSAAPFADGQLKAQKPAIYLRLIWIQPQRPRLPS